MSEATLNDPRAGHLVLSSRYGMRTVVLSSSKLVEERFGHATFKTMKKAHEDLEKGGPHDRLERHADSTDLDERDAHI